MNIPIFLCLNWNVKIVPRGKDCCIFNFWPGPLQLLHIGDVILSWLDLRLEFSWLILWPLIAKTRNNG